MTKVVASAGAVTEAKVAGAKAEVVAVTTAVAAAANSIDGIWQLRQQQKL